MASIEFYNRIEVDCFRNYCKILWEFFDLEQIIVQAFSDNSLDNDEVHFLHDYLFQDLDSLYFLETVVDDDAIQYADMALINVF